MPTRIYDAKLLDFQIAPCTDTKTDTGLPRTWSKSQMAATLSKYVDAKTLAVIPETFLATALRWRTSTDLGLPLTPFKVYKRKKSLPFAETQIISIPGFNSTLFTNAPYWQLSFTLRNTNFLQEKITVAPLDHNQQPMADTEVVYTVPAMGTVPVKMKFPNMWGIGIISGPGVAQNITGIRMEDFLNDKDWQLIDTVGLPFKAGTPNPLAYQNSLQGFPNAPVDGYQAGINRLAIAQVFYQQPTYLQPDGVTLPAWPLPVPTTLIDSYHKTHLSLDGKTKIGVLLDIEDMLTRVHTDPSFYFGKQKNYLKDFQTKGFSDNGIQNSGVATISNPVCGTTLLGVATDCWNSVGLGFGTTDFAGLAAGAVASYAIDSDYMVAASFRLPRYSEGWDPFMPVMKFDHFDTFEVAALAHPALPLPPVTGLKNEIFSENRPLSLDQHFSDDVKVYWDKPGNNVPTGYAIGIKDTFTNQLGYLNTDRPFLPGVKRPYVPAARADADAQDLQGSDAVNINRFFHHRSERSDAGNAIKNYYVAANDVFGRWNAFQKTVSTLPKAPQVAADIISGRFILDTSTASGHAFPNTILELIIAWHWDDRSPAQIIIGGHFQTFPVPPLKLDINSVPKPPGVRLDNVSLASTNLSIIFNGTTPTVPAAIGTIEKDDTNSAPPDTIAYRLRIKTFNLDFNGASKLGYAVYIRSSVKLAPAAFTLFGNVKMIYAIDPLPWMPPVILPDIQWASLPDAANISRFRVSFTAVPNVAGYAIYRATESALREKTSLPDVNPDTDPKPTILDRAKDLDDQQKDPVKRKFAKDAFIRISTELLTQPQVDVELPGDLDGLYVYALTTFTDQRVESGFSGWMFVGVPRRYTPPAPALLAFTKKNGAQRDITLKIEVPPGVRTECLEIFKTTKEYLAASIDLMGLPYTTGGLKDMPAGWKAYNRDDQEITPVTLNSPVAYYKVTETIAPGWQPLHYRAAGFGQHDIDTGKFPGRSRSSNMVAIQVAPPDAPPVLKNATLDPLSSMLWRIDFFTDADIHETPFGNFKLKIQKRNVAANVYEDVLLKDIPAIAKMGPNDIPKVGSLYRIAGKDASGCYEYEYYVAGEPEGWYQIIVSDPLGRSASAKVHYKNPVVIVQNIVVKPLNLSVELDFDVNISNKVPPYGHFKLEIFTIKDPTQLNPHPAAVLMYTGILDNLSMTIPPPATNPAVYIDAKAVKTGFYTYYAVFKGNPAMAAFKDAGVIIRITDPNGKMTEFSNTRRVASH